MRSHGQKSGGGHDAIENLPDYVGKPTPAKRPDKSRAPPGRSALFYAVSVAV